MGRRELTRKQARPALHSCPMARHFCLCRIGQDSLGPKSISTTPKPGGPSIFASESKLSLESKGIPKNRVALSNPVHVVNNTIAQRSELVRLFATVGRLFTYR